jgi:lipopolysaccharide export system protein LptA
MPSADRFLAGLAAALMFSVLATAAFAQKQSRQTGLKLSGDEPIQIESDRLEVRENENIAIFTGNVSVVQGDMLMKAGRMVVHYAEGSGSVTTGSSNVELIEVEGKVYLEQEGQVVTGDRGRFDLLADRMELTGEKVVLTEGDNVVVGCRLEVEMSTGEARLQGCGDRPGDSGRVRMLLKPGSQQR